MNRIPELIAQYNERHRAPDEPLMTQRRLAELVGTSESLLSRYVCGSVDASFSRAREIAEVLCVSVDDLFSDALDLPAVVTKAKP